jgi:hypothetical protein
MRKYHLQIFLTVIVSIILIIFALLLVNRYLYSWTGFLANKVGLCKFRTVSVSGYNASPAKLTFLFDPEEIAREMSKNENYKVNGFSNKHYVSVTRTFDGIIYNLTLHNGGGLQDGFSVDTLLPAPEHPNLIGRWGGEHFATPDYILKNKIYTMIDDLPLTKEQKDEMKQLMYCQCVAHSRSLF